MTSRALPVALAIGPLLLACGSPEEAEFDLIQAPSTNGEAAEVATVPELVADPSSYGITILEGTITEVEEGVGMIWSIDSDGEERELLTFHDDAAAARTVHLTMAVGGAIAITWTKQEVQFGLTISEEEDVESLRERLTAGRYLVFLTESPLFDYAPDLYGVVLDGGLLCRRGTEHPLECPALEDDLAEELDVDAVTDEHLEPIPAEVPDTDD